MMNQPRSRSIVSGATKFTVLDRPKTRIKMKEEQYLRELSEAFGDFRFFEQDHHYEFRGQLVNMSATKLIEQYANEFDSETVAERVANKEGKTIQQVLDEWKYRNEFACVKGSVCHEYVQCLWNKNDFDRTDFDGSKEFLKAVDVIESQADRFYEDYKDKLQHLADEYIIGSEEYDIASAVDHLFINKLTNELVLVDYKTNSDMYKNDKYAKSMKVPLHHLKDTTLNHYCIQVSMYKFLIEKYTNLKVSEMFIVWLSENNDNYQIVETPYLKKEVFKILENRRVKNMNSVPVLLIGQSGSGKSTSLRNFKGDEVAVVNVLGKPLPFKSDIKAGKCDDYATILKAIANTPKKTIVIDDAGYLITNEFMGQASVKGFDKYNTLANNFFDFINKIKNIQGGKTIYIVMHEDSNDDGTIKPKTIGKLLDDRVNFQGMFTVCIRSMYENGNYVFKLKTNGQDCVKTPFGMFESESMENDLKAFDKVVREYYELDKKEGEE